jgi:CRP/FNR family cyclic AMP-dependent transcriptional regulator
VIHSAYVTWPLLASLTDDARDRVVQAARLRRFAKGEVIFHDGDAADALHLLRSGRLAVRVSLASGDTATLSVLSPGEAFGELALLGEGRDRTATVVALERSETLVLSRAAFNALRSQHSGVDQLLVELLGRRVDELSRLLVEALYVGVDHRVIHRLVDLVEAYGADAKGATTITITQDDLADMAGTTRPSANQVLQRLVATGTVALGRGRIEILDLDDLRRRSRR